MICPITNNYCRTNGCGEKCYKRDSLGYSTAPQHDAKLPVSESVCVCKHPVRVAGDRLLEPYCGKCFKDFKQTVR